MNNYSEIVKNNYQIIDLFKKFRDRKQRVEAGEDQNREKFFRAMKQNKIELDRQRFNYMVERGFEMAKGIQV